MTQATVRGVPARLWWMILPLALAPLGLLPPDSLVLVPAALLGLGIVALAVRHPQHASLAFVLLVGFQRPLQALLLQVVPASIVRASGFTKEALLAGIVFAAWTTAKRRGHVMDRLDRAILLFMTLVAAYFVVPIVLSPIMTLFPSAPTGLFAKLLAIRANVGLLVVLLAARSLDIHPRWRRRIATAAIAIAAAAAMATLVEFVDTDLWRRIENRWLELPQLRVRVYDTAADARPTYSIVAGARLVRAGAWSDFLTIGFLMIGPLAVSLGRSALAPTPRRILVTGLIAAGVIATLTRSAFLAVVIMTAMTALSFPRSRRSARTRLLLLAGIGTVLALGLASSSGLVERTTSALSGTESSAEEHVNATTNALQRAVRQPLGLGLGVQPVTAQRSSDGTYVVAENAYLQVANELGVVTAIVFVIILWRLVAALRRKHEPIATALAGATAGVALAGLFLHVWIAVDGPWILMMLAGLWLPRTARDHRRPESPRLTVAGRPAARAW